MATVISLPVGTGTGTSFLPVPYNLPRRVSSNMENETPELQAPISTQSTTGPVYSIIPAREQAYPVLPNNYDPFMGQIYNRAFGNVSTQPTIAPGGRIIASSAPPPSAPLASPEQDNSWRARNRLNRSTLGLNELQNLRRTQYIKAFTGGTETPELPFNYIQLFEGQRLSPEDFNYMEAVQLGLIDPTQGYNWGRYGSRAVIRPSVLRTGRSPWTVGNRSRVVQGPGSAVIPGTGNNTSNPTAPSSGPGFFATMRSGVPTVGGRSEVQGSESTASMRPTSVPGIWSRLGGTLARGARAAGGAIKRGAVTAGGAIKRGAVTAGGAIKRGARAAGSGIARGASAAGSGIARGATATYERLGNMFPVMGGRGNSVSGSTTVNWLRPTATQRFMTGAKRGAAEIRDVIVNSGKAAGRGAVSAFVTVGKGAKRLASQATTAYQERKERKEKEERDTIKAKILSKEKREAATAFQSIFRGNKARKNVAQIKAKRSAERLKRKIEIETARRANPNAAQRLAWMEQTSPSKLARMRRDNQRIAEEFSEEQTEIDEEFLREGLEGLDISQEALDAINERMKEYYKNAYISKGIQVTKPEIDEILETGSRLLEQEIDTIQRFKSLRARKEKARRREIEAQLRSSAGYGDYIPPEYSGGSVSSRRSTPEGYVRLPSPQEGANRVSQNTNPTIRRISRPVTNNSGESMAPVDGAPFAPGYGPGRRIPSTMPTVSAITSMEAELAALESGAPPAVATAIGSAAGRGARDSPQAAAAAAMTVAINAGSPPAIAAAIGSVAEAVAAVSENDLMLAEIRLFAEQAAKSVDRANAAVTSLEKKLQQQKDIASSAKRTLAKKIANEMVSLINLAVINARLHLDNARKASKSASNELTAARKVPGNTVVVNIARNAAKNAAVKAEKEALTASRLNETHP